MAIANGDILEIVDVQTYLGQQCLNVYNYEMVTRGPDTTYENITDSFQLMITTYIDAIQNPAVEHIRVVVRNLTNGLDIYEEPWSAFGAQVGATMPSFVAWSFRLVRSTLATRHGGKRIVGVTEDNTSGNQPIAGSLAALNAAATAMGSLLSRDAGDDADFTAMPVIVGTILEGEPNAGQPDLSRINPIQAGQFIRLSTQTTRREGRGI